MRSCLEGKRIYVIGRLKGRLELTAKSELAGARFQDKMNSQTNIVLIPDNADDFAGKFPSSLRHAWELEKLNRLQVLKESDYQRILETGQLPEAGKGSEI